MEFTYHMNEQLTITMEVQKMQHFVRAMSFLQELPEKCPLCESPVRFFYRNPQDYDYYGLRCEGEPAHETNFGQKKKTGEFFYKGKWEKEYQGDEQNRSQPQSQEKPPVEEDNMDDLPF